MIDSLWLYHCGYATVPQSFLFRDQRADTPFVKLPFMALAAQHSELGLLLFDAPYGHDGPRNIGMLGALISASSLLSFRPSWSIIPRLEQMGLRSSKVQHVLMTHLHYDHTGGMKELGHAQFHVSQREWEFARGVTRLQGLRSGYSLSDYRALHGKVRPFATPDAYDRHDPGFDLFGDGSVRAVSLPGHTIGHTGYLISLSDGRRFFHAGDAAYDLRQIFGRVEPGLMASTATWDKPTAAFTLSELQRFHEENQEVTLITSHDVALGERCLEGPVLL